MLWVSRCEEMEEIVAAKQNEGREEEERVDYKMFSKVSKKSILNTFQTQVVSAQEETTFLLNGHPWKYFRVRDCSKMMTFDATTSGSTPKLNQVRLDESETPLQGMDLNQFVQNRFKAT
ncbi:hypothetical protein CsSME_00030890 [Camellia sinensis var. sinensis]